MRRGRDCYTRKEKEEEVMSLTLEVFEVGECGGATVVGKVGGCLTSTVSDPEISSQLSVDKYELCRTPGHNNLDIVHNHTGSLLLLLGLYIHQIQRSEVQLIATCLFVGKY